MSTDYDDYYDEGFEWPIWAGGAVALVVVAAMLWFGFGAILGGNDDAAVVSNTPSEPAVTAGAQPTDPSEDGGSTTSSSTTIESATGAAAPVTSRPAVAAPDGPVTYPTLEDGSPVPVLAIFDDEIIAFSGVVPSEAAAERLRIIAIAYSTSPGEQVASFLTVNPDVPADVGVRIIETDAAQFDAGSPGISVEYVAQLDRIAALMTSMPGVTVEVVGHADQRDDDSDNVELSVERARGSVDYLVTQGVDPGRLSFRGVGEADLLTLNNDAVALALNRRTEFIFYGLLADESSPN